MPDTDSPFRKKKKKIFMKYFMLYVKHTKFIQFFTDILYIYHIIMLLLSLSPPS